MGLNITARDLRRMNRRTVLQAMFVDGIISRLELSQRSGLSTGTVTNVVAELLTEGIILESGFEASNGGRRRTVLTLNREYGYFFGGEIGETDVAVELFDITLQKLQSVRYPLQRVDNHPAQVIRYVVDGVAFLLQEAQLRADKILGFGLGLPGIVEYTEKELVLAPDHLRELASHHPLLAGSEHDEIGAILALLHMVHSGGSVAAQVVNDTLQYLGAGIANLLNLFNPQRVIIGGWLGLQLGGTIFPALQQAVRRYALAPAFDIANMSLSQLGRDSVSSGAAVLCLENFIETIGAGKDTPALATVK